jgi:hypothetical protein
MRLGQRGDNVEVQRFADRTGFLGAVQHADRAYRRRQCVEQRPGGERAVQPHLYHADPLAAFDESGDGLHRGLGARAHQHQHSLRLRVPGVVDDAHLAAGALAEAGHQVLDHTGNPRVERVHRFPRLEEDVGVLRGAANEGALGRQRPSAMRPHQLLGHQRPQVVVGKRLNRVDFVRGSESVEEMHERYPGRQCGRLRNERQVLCLLHGGRREHGEPRLPHGHHVGMVTEDRQCLRCH